jgi:hypothetical protein
MRVLLLSGLLYLLGVAIVLSLKPSFMFTADGAWKEFGIGRNPEKYTVFPFWMFAVTWAVVSFFMIQLLATLGVLPGVEWTRIESVPAASGESVSSRGRKSGPQELKPGYYMLNTEGTAAEGVPKYIYIGSAPAED